MGAGAEKRGPGCGERPSGGVGQLISESSLAGEEEADRLPLCTGDFPTIVPDTGL